MSASEIVNKAWNYAHVLRDDGIGYGNYVEAAPGIHALYGAGASMHNANHLPYHPENG